MNPISLYLSTFDNTKKWYSTIPEMKYLVVLSRFPAIKKNKIVGRLFWVACSVLEPFASIVLVVYYSFIYLIKKLKTQLQPLSNNLFLYFVPLLKDRTVSAGLYDSSIDWLIPLSEQNLNNRLEGKRIHTVLEAITIVDLLKSLFLSIAAIICATVKNHFCYVFRNHVSLEFFLTYYYLKRIPKDTTLYFSNQIDRWSTLFDRAPQSRKVLLQHGIEDPKANWPVKLENTGVLYSLSKEESVNVVNAVFAKQPEVRIMAPTITLSDMGNQNTFKVLIVGYPECRLFEKEKEFIRKLQNPGITVFLKLHPGKEDISQYEELLKTYNYILIKDQRFPKVDIVLSYLSTLAVEYQACGIKVLQYSKYSVDEMVNYIYERCQKV